ncbi:ABC transporter substrate-binding protein [Paenibacillus sp. TRM 82003]|nr:ABC transporter substrate-binding protein [Paenibacillus sp. TRM 82003]
MLRRSSFSFASIFLVVLLLAGCGGGTQQASEGSNQTSAAAPAPGGTTSTNAPAAEVPAVEAATPEYPKTVDHLSGTIALEKQPETIAAVDKQVVDILVMLGHPPAASEGFASMTRSTILQPYVQDLELIDLGGKVNREALLDLEPDLILLTETKIAQYEELNILGPTAVVAGAEDYPTRIRQMAALVGEEEKGEQIIADFNKQVEETKAALDPDFSETVLVLRANGKDFTAYSTAEFSILYDGLGLTPVPSLLEGGQLTIEGLSEASPDHIIIAENRRRGDPENPNGLVHMWKDNPVWQSLKAVKNDNVYIVDSTFVEPFFACQIAALDIVKEHLASK